MTKRTVITAKAAKEARDKRISDKIAELSGSQARVALYGILRGASLENAIETAKTYVEP